jgi:hypothetical protein
MKWYVSLYTTVGEKSYRLLDYVECNSLDSAKIKVSKSRSEYATDFWHLESTLGSLDTSTKGVFHRREQYSHNTKAATSQAEGEERAKKVLRSIRSLKPTSSIAHIQSIMKEVRTLKPYLTKTQYDTILTELERQPIIRKLLLEE